MALSVLTNAMSSRVNASLNKSTSALNTSYQRLSTGLRINSAKDDAAGLQISDRLTAQINGLYQGNRNANDGISLAQTAEGAMDEITTMLQRIRTLSEQSATGTNTDADRTAMQDEVKALSNEITRIGQKTTFGGQTILNGPGQGLVGSTGNVAIQVGANANDTIDVSFGTVAFTVAGMGSAAVGAATGIAVSNGVYKVDTASAAQATTAYIDSVLAYVDKRRGEFGAVQNRLESTIRNQENIAANTESARSRIRDTDFTTESAQFTANQIAQQLGASMLSQVKSSPQIALSLLQ